MATDSTVDPATTPAGADPAAPAETPAALVASALGLKQEIADKQAALLVIEGKLIALGAGTYKADDGRAARVIAARLGSPGAIYYALPKDGLEQARKLAGKQFKALFDRTEVFTPCSGFALVAPKVLTPAKAKGILALCERMTSGTSGARAHVKYA